MVLLAVVDAQYLYICIDVRAVGAESDGGVWVWTHLNTLFETQKANLPPPEILPQQSAEAAKVPYFFVGDDAFPLRPRIMKPFQLRGLTKEERVYNYRLSRARRTVENAFGILANRFRVLRTSICLRPDRVKPW